MAITVLISQHMQRYPEHTFHDVYKLLHQAAFGPGHAVVSMDKALEWVERDLEDAGPPAPLVEAIHPDGALVRLHLRPYAAQGGDLVLLCEAFGESAETFSGEAAQMARWWSAFTGWAGDHTDFAPRELKLFGSVMAGQSWPADHHSPRYRAAYRPAYRVLTAAAAEALCERQGLPFTPV